MRITESRTGDVERLSAYCSVVFLMLLIAGDFVFVALHFIGKIFELTPLLNIEKDQGYAEFYQYTKFFWIFSLLIYLCFWRDGRFLAWAFLFLYLLADDALSIHENVGGIISERLDFAPLFGLRLQDYGELAVTGVMFIFLFGPLFWVYWNGSQEFKSTSRNIAILLSSLIFFGVVVDMLHVMVDFGGRVSFLLGVVEDGGEMLSVSLVLWYVFLIGIRPGHINFYSKDIVGVAIPRMSS